MAERPDEVTLAAIRMAQHILEARRRRAEERRAGRTLAVVKPAKTEAA